MARILIQKDRHGKIRATPIEDDGLFDFLKKPRALESELQLAVRAPDLEPKREQP